MQSQGMGSVSVTLTSVPEGARLVGGTPGQQALDMGTVSYGTGARSPHVTVNRLPGRFEVTTQFGMSIQDPSKRFSSAAVLASLGYPENVYTLWLDGVKLAPTPQIIQGRTQLGPTVEHRLRIEVPASATEKNAQLHNAVVFQVIPN